MTPDEFCYLYEKVEEARKFGDVKEQIALECRLATCAPKWWYGQYDHQNPLLYISRDGEIIWEEA